MRDVVTAVVGLVAIAALVLHFENPLKKNEMVYVNLPEVFNGFTMKQELGAELDQVLISRQAMVDSLKRHYDLTVSMNGGEISETSQRLLQELRYKEARFAEDNQLAAQQFNEQIWKQLNVYMKEYGTESPYKIILGAQGDGGLIHAEETMDITDELIEYVNNRYAGQ